MGVTGTFSGSLTDNGSRILSLRIGRPTALESQGTLVLSGNNTYSGATSIGAEISGFSNTVTLAIDSDARLGTAPGTPTASHVFFEGTGPIIGTLRFTESMTLNANRGIGVGNSTSNNGNAGFEVDAGKTVTYNGAIALGTGATTANGIRKSGAGTFVLGGANTYTGTTSVLGGVLQLSAAQAVSGTVTRPYEVAGGGALVFAFGLDNTYLDKVATASAGAVALAESGTKSTALDFSSLTAASLGAVGSGTQVYTGTLTPNGSTYRIGGGGGTLDFASKLTGSRTLTVGGNVAGLGGTVIVSNTTNDFTGDTTVQKGVLEIASLTDRGVAGLLGSGTTITLGSGTSGATLRYTGGGSSASNRLISLGGTTAGGGGTIDSSSSGSSSFLDLRNGTVSPSAESNTTLLTLTGVNTGSNAIGVITGSSVSVTKSGPGTWRMTGSSSFEGQMSIRNGTIVADVGAPSSGTSGVFGKWSSTVVPLIGDTSSGASGTAALLLGASGVTIDRRLDVEASNGTQTVMLGGANTSGTSFFGAGSEIRLGSGRAVNLVAANSGNVQFAGVLSDGGGSTNITNAFTVGADNYGGIVQLNNTLATSGTVSVVNGRLDVLAAVLEGEIAGELSAGQIVVNGPAAELRFNGSSSLTSPLALTRGTLSGTGVIATAVTVGTNAFVAPGNSPGIQPYTSLHAWAPFGTYEWELNAVSGTSGTNWDLIDVSGTFSLAGLSATPGDQFALDLITLAAGDVAGQLASPYDGGSYTFAIASYDPTKVLLPTGFSNAAGTDLTSLFTINLGNWQGVKPQVGDVSVKINSTADGIDLVIVPEPETLSLAGIGVAAAAWAFRRRRA